MNREGPHPEQGAAPRAVRDSKCLGCADTILATSKHMCGGSRIPSDELGWRCVCSQPECRRRQTAGGNSPRTTPGEQPAALHAASTVNTGG